MWGMRSGGHGGTGSMRQQQSPECFARPPHRVRFLGPHSHWIKTSTLVKTARKRCYRKWKWMVLHQQMGLPCRRARHGDSMIVRAYRHAIIRHTVCHTFEAPEIRSRRGPPFFTDSARNSPWPPPSTPTHTSPRPSALLPPAAAASSPSSDWETGHSHPSDARPRG